MPARHLLVSLWLASIPQVLPSPEEGSLSKTLSGGEACFGRGSVPLSKARPPGQAVRVLGALRAAVGEDRRPQSGVQEAGVPARPKWRGRGVGKVGAGAGPGERYLSVYLRVPPAPIAGRSEPVAGRVATRSGCPLFWCQEGAWRARGAGGRKGTGRGRGPPRMGAGEVGGACFGAPSTPELDKPLLGGSFIHSFTRQQRQKRQVKQRQKEVCLTHTVLSEASLPSLLLALLSKVKGQWVGSSESWNHESVVVMVGYVRIISMLHSAMKT